MDEQKISSINLQFQSEIDSEHFRDSSSCATSEAGSIRESRRMATPGYLLNRKDIQRLCHCPGLSSNTSAWDVSFAGNAEDQDGGFIDVTVESLVDGLKDMHQAVHIYVSWMMPHEDESLEAARKQMMEHEGIMCWLPDGMDQYERARQNKPLNSWVKMLEKANYAQFKANLEGYSWPAAMQTLVLSLERA
jgi:hypothetical protein